MQSNDAKNAKSPNAPAPKNVGKAVQSLGNPDQKPKSPDNAGAKNTPDKPKSDKPAPAPVPKKVSNGPKVSKAAATGADDILSTEKDRKSAKKKLNMNRLMVTKVYDLNDCQFTNDDLDSMALGGLAVGAHGQLDQTALITRSKNGDPNAITDLHIKQLPTMTSAVLLADESTPLRSSATPRTKEADAKKREARKKTLSALKKILDNKNLRTIAREGRQRREALDALGCTCQHLEPCKLSGTKVSMPLDDADAHPCCSEAARQLVYPPPRLGNEEDHRDLEDGLNVTVSKQNNEFLISIKAPKQDNVCKASPRGRRGNSKLAEPPELKGRKYRGQNHISTVKLKERDFRGESCSHRDAPRGRSGSSRQGRSQSSSWKGCPLEARSQIQGEFRVRSNSGGLDLVQTSPLFIPWQAIDGDSGSFEHSSYCVNRDRDKGTDSEHDRCEAMFPHVRPRLNARPNPARRRERRGDSTSHCPSAEHRARNSGEKGCDFKNETDCEICRHLMHYEYHSSADVRIPCKSSKDRSPPKTQPQRKSQRDRRTSKSARGRKSIPRRGDNSSRERANSGSRSKMGRKSSKNRIKPTDKKDKKDLGKPAPSRKSHQERKRYVKALEKFISFKPQAMLSQKSTRRKAPARRHRSSSGESGGSGKQGVKKPVKSQTNAKRGAQKGRPGKKTSDAGTRTQSEPSEINHHEPLLSSQGRRRVPKSRKAPKGKGVKKSSKSKAPPSPLKSTKNLSTLVKGGSPRRTSKYSFFANASAEETATQHSIVNYGTGNVAGPTRRFENSSEADMPVLKGGREMPRTKSSWKDLVQAERLASLKHPINERLDDKLTKEVQTKKNKKSLFRSKLSGMLNVFARQGGRHRRKEAPKFTAEKESKTELPGFEASRSNSHFRLIGKEGEQRRGWLNLDAQGDVGFTDDDKTCGWADADFGKKKEEKRKRKTKLSTSDDDSSLAEVTSYRWEDWSSSSSFKSRHTRRRR